MKLVFRIDEYLPETQQIVVRMCKSLSREPILGHNPGAVDLKNLDPDGDGFACAWDPSIYRQLAIPADK